MYTNETFIGKAIRKFRQDNGLTVKDFIKKLDVDISPTYINKLETSIEDPSPKVACKVAGLLGYRPEVFLQIIKDNKISKYNASLEKRNLEALSVHKKRKEDLL